MRRKEPFPSRVAGAGAGAGAAGETLRPHLLPPPLQVACRAVQEDILAAAAPLLAADPSLAADAPTEFSVRARARPAEPPPLERSACSFLGRALSLFHLHPPRRRSPLAVSLSSPLHCPLPPTSHGP